MIYFDISNLKDKIHELEKIINNPDFWSNYQDSTTILSKISCLKNKLNNYINLKKEIDDLQDLNDLLLKNFDNELALELVNNTNNIEKEINKIEISTLLTNKYDRNNAILTLHSGAGGIEAQDWVQMLYRMYARWSTNNGYSIKELDYLEGDEAGIKSVTFLIAGENAYGYIKGEMGVHRLVRISPFDSGKRRHTSFASVEVLPEISEDNQFDINLDDLKIDTYRSSGAGGQHINKTDSAVRITHLPTKIVVSCQAERSQIQNKETAMKMLKSKLLKLKEQENKERIEDLKGTQKEIAWGSQIRSYIFCPYTLVKDHRTNYQTSNIEAVINGDLNNFIESYLKLKIKKQVTK